MNQARVLYGVLKLFLGQGLSSSTELVQVLGVDQVVLSELLVGRPLPEGTLRTIMDRVRSYEH